MDTRTLQYQLEYTDTGERTKTINPNTFGSGTDLEFTVVDENGSAVDLTTVSTSMKIYIGTLSALKVDGGTLVDVSVANGKVKFPLVTGSFAEGDVGYYTVELQFMNNAVYANASLVIRAGGASLRVEDNIQD